MDWLRAKTARERNLPIARSTTDQKNLVTTSGYSNTEMIQSETSNGFTKQQLINPITSFTSLQNPTQSSGLFPFTQTPNFSGWFLLWLSKDFVIIKAVQSHNLNGFTGSSNNQKNTFANLSENKTTAFPLLTTNGLEKPVTLPTFPSFQNPNLQSTGLFSFSQKPVLYGNG